MNTKLIKKENNKVSFEMTIAREAFDVAMEKAYRKNIKKFNIPGFRKGKAPRKLIEKFYTEAVFYDDAINFAFPEAYDVSIKELELDPVDRPDVDIKEIEPGKDVVLDIKVTIKPEVELGEYKGIKVTEKVYNVSDDEINAQIEKKRDQASRLITVEDRPVAQGDTTIIDFEGFVNDIPFEGGKGEDFSLVIGSGQFIPGFEEQLVGKNIEDDVEVRVTFPEDYQADDLKGKEALFKVKIKELKFKELPELDDDFAKDVSEFETLEELKTDIMNKMVEANTKRAKSELENAAVDAVVANAKVELPEVMIEKRIDDMVQDFEMRLKQQGMSLDIYMQYTGMDMPTFRGQFKDQAQVAVKNSLVLEAVSKAEKIEASDEDVENQLQELSKAYNVEMEKIKEIFNGDRLDDIKKDCAISKTIDFILKNATIEAEVEKTQSQTTKTTKKASAGTPAKTKANKPMKKD